MIMLYKERKQRCGIAKVLVCALVLSWTKQAMSFGPNDKILKLVEDKLGYTFRDKWLLRQAFIHPSAGEFNHLRLAWIGDAAMQLIVSDLVYESLPDNATTDILTDRRKTMVMRDFCAEGAIKLGWDKVAVAGKSFPKDKELTTNMLAETFEAVWGAIYKDSGNNQQVVHDVYKRLFPLHTLSSSAAAVEAAAATAEESAMAVQTWWNNID